jgi:hypothetical protein
MGQQEIVASSALRRMILVLTVAALMVAIWRLARCPPWRATREITPPGLPWFRETQILTIRRSWSTIMEGLVSFTLGVRAGQGFMVGAASN